MVDFKLCDNGESNAGFMTKSTPKRVAPGSEYGSPTGAVVSGSAQGHTEPRNTKYAPVDRASQEKF